MFVSGGLPSMMDTVTHARVRAEQGDVEGALRILASVLAAVPGDAEALALRSRLARPDARLNAWIARVQARRGARRDR